MAVSTPSEAINKWGRRSVAGYLILLVFVGMAVWVRQADVARIARDEQAIKASRIRAVQVSCREANERHVIAQKGLEALAARTAPRNPTLAQAKQRKAVLNAFVDALAPTYDCQRRVQELATP